MSFSSENTVQFSRKGILFFTIKKKKEKSLKFISVNRKVEKRIRLSLSKTYYKADLVFFQIVIT